MNNKINSTEHDNISTSLNISEQRHQEIINTIYDIMEKFPNITYTAAAEQITNRLELNTNEVFFLGVVIGHYSNMNSLINFFESMRTFTNIPKNVMPVIRKVAEC
jgi:phosphohistidine phosphatase SixA